VALAAKDGTAWVARVERGPRIERTASAAGGSQERVVRADEFATLLDAVVAEGGVLLADGHLDAGFSERARSAGAAHAPLAVDVRAFAAVSCEILAAGGAVRAVDLHPIYAREPEAVTKWRARAGERASS
jgi:hypothetical protein